MADTITTLQSLNPLFFLKIAILMIIGLFLIFTLIVYNQVGVMNRIVDQPEASGTLRIIALINVILAVSLFLTALVIL